MRETQREEKHTYEKRTDKQNEPGFEKKERHAESGQYGATGKKWCERD